MALRIVKAARTTACRGRAALAGAACGILSHGLPFQPGPGRAGGDTGRAVAAAVKGHARRVAAVQSPDGTDRQKAPLGRWHRRQMKPHPGHKYLVTGFALLVHLATSSGAGAQTAAEAAAINVQYAMTVCLENYRTPLNIPATFVLAGLAHTRQDIGNGTVADWFSAPGDTMNVAVIADRDSTECRIGTTHYGVEQMLPFARAVVGQLFSAEIYDGAPEGYNILPGTPQARQDVCSGFHLFAPRKLIWVKLARAGNDATCISDGTAQIIMKM